MLMGQEKFEGVQFTKDKRCAFPQANFLLMSVFCFFFADFRTFPADFRGRFPCIPFSAFWLRKLQTRKSGKEAVTRCPTAIGDE